MVISLVEYVLGNKLRMDYLSIRYLYMVNISTENIKIYGGIIWKINYDHN